MKIHEYQAKEIFARYGIPVPQGRVATAPDAASEIAADIGGSVVVKAQVHAGGRGKAGGIRVVNSPQAAAEAAESMLGTTLVTFQTGPEGVPVSSVLVEEAVEVESEMYVGMAVDGAAEGIVAIASAAGGMEIEEVAESTPEKILTVAIDPVLGLQSFQGRKLAYGLGVADSLNRPVAALMASLYKLFEENDCFLVEINPLGVTTDGRVLAMDAKINIDDDAMFRHRDIVELRDTEQEDPLEVEASAFDINYVKLDGDVGCIVNGAGLAMATMDVTHAAGASPANFLDIGGGADEEKVARSLEIVLSDDNVRRVLVNIFGGILRWRCRRARLRHGLRASAGQDASDGRADARHQLRRGTRHTRQLRPRRRPRRRPQPGRRGHPQRRLGDAMTAAENSSTVPMNGIVAVMEEREYEVIDHTMHSWVFRSKNPDAYGFTLPSTWKPIPEDMLRHALRSEPLDADEVIEQAFEKAAYYEAERRERERLDPTPKGITFEEAKKKFNIGPTQRTPEELRKIQRMLDGIDAANKSHRDYTAPTDTAENLDYYIYDAGHCLEE